MLIPVLGVLAGGAWLWSRKKKRPQGSRVVRPVVAAGPPEADAWSWRVLDVPGGFLGQWRRPGVVGFAQAWTDVPAGVSSTADIAYALALEQIALAQQGSVVVDSGVAQSEGLSVPWRVVVTEQGLYRAMIGGLVEGSEVWIELKPDAINPADARALALEGAAMAMAEVSDAD